MPAENVVRSWAVENHDDFGGRFMRAREIGCAELADQIIEIADQAHDSDSAAAARVQTETRRWLLSKLLPKTYGDRVDLNHNVTVNVAAALAEARRRAGLLEHATLAVDALPEPIVLEFEP